MNYKEIAKQFVNEIYQPLGQLNCQVSSQKMWDYAKDVAVVMIENFEKNLEGELYNHWIEVKYEIKNSL